MTPELDIDGLRNVASRFRKAIEACPRGRLSISFQEFPLGSCGDATLLLGTYLLEHGFGPFNYIFGVRGESGHTHAWLRRDQLDIDITADQFADAPKAIMVGIDTPWHRTFRQEIRGIANFREYDEHTVATLNSDLRLIVARLELSDGLDLRRSNP